MVKKKIKVLNRLKIRVNLNQIKINLQLNQMILLVIIPEQLPFLQGLKNQLKRINKKP